MYRNTSRRLIAALMTIALLFGLVFIPAPTASAGETVKVIVDFEGYNLGHGFYIKPAQLELSAGATVADAIEELLYDTGHESKGISSNYLSAVKGFAVGEAVTIPAYITDNGGPATAQANAEGRKETVWLGETDYSEASGWMYTLNDEDPGQGIKGVTLTDGDVIRVQFTVWGYGADLGMSSSGYGGDAAYYTKADKTELIRALFTDGASKDSINTAHDVIISPLANSSAVSNALTAIADSVAPPEPPAPQYPEWVEISSTGSGKMLAALKAALDAPPYSQGGTYDYSVVKKLKITGTISNTSGSPNDFKSIRDNLGDYLVELDLSGASAFGNLRNDGTNDIKMKVLEKLTLPNINSVGGAASQLDFLPALKSIVVGANTGDISYSNFVTGGCSSLESITFLNANSPLKKVDVVTAPNVIAYVPDKTGGGYEAELFTNQFSEVRSLNETPTPAASEEEFAALGAAIDKAKGLTEADYKPETWTKMTGALTAAQTIFDKKSSISSAVNSATAELTSAIDALQLNSGKIFVRVTKGAEIGLYKKPTNHFAVFTKYALTSETEKSDADYDWYSFTNSTVPNGDYHIEASIPGQTSKVARMYKVTSSSGGTTINIDLTPLANWTTAASNYSSDMYTNLGDSGTLNLSAGETFELDTFRVWQALEGVTANYFIEPNYTFEVSGDSAKTERIGAPGRQRLKITADKPGTSVIKITYDPVEYITQSGNNLRFNGNSSWNTGVVVVNVGGGNNFNTGITLKNDFDTLYFDKTKGSRTFTFTPASGTTVRVHDPLNITAWGSGRRTYTAAKDGSFTVTLKEGRNIVELRNGGNLRYYVIKAKGVTVTVTNKSRVGQALAAGDIAKIDILGMETPIQKLAGVYNPGFGTSLAPYIKYTDGTTEIKGATGGQYTTLIDTFSVEYTFTSDPAKNKLTGQLWIGDMGAAPGLHREIPANGFGANMGASSFGPYGFGALPEITLIPDAGEEYEAALEKALAYIKANTANPTYDSVNGEWAVLSRARMDIEDTAWYNKYLANLIAETAKTDPVDGKVILHSKKRTDNERVIIALTALGYDARDYQNYDFVSALFDRQGGEGSDLQAGWQGTNGAAFALIALDTAGYPDEAIRTELIDWLLPLQHDDKGWVISATSALSAASSVDMTAMVVQALAPYYGADVKVQTAVDGAVTWLLAQTPADAEGISQIIVALTALGKSEAQIKPYIEQLLKYQVESGAFKHISMGTADQMATEQAAYALVAYYRYTHDQTSLYDMTDVTDITNPGAPPPITVDKTALQAAISQATALNSSRYTASSWNAMNSAMTGAQSVNADLNATQTQVDEARKSLLAAIDALVLSGGQTGDTTIKVTFTFTGDTHHYVSESNKGTHSVPTWISRKTVELPIGATVKDLTDAQLNAAGISFATTNGGGYIATVKGLSEFDNGPNSGWMYRLNGVIVGVGYARQKLSNGDNVYWFYTDDYTKETGYDDSFKNDIKSGNSSASSSTEPLTSQALSKTEDSKPQQSTHSDVNSGNWFFEAVVFVTENKLMNGTGNGQFSPNENLTRAMLVTILHRIADEPSVDNGGAFKDVDPSKWYTNAVEWATAEGIANGYGDGSFGPGDSITREQMVVLLFRFAKSMNYDISARAELSGFADTGDISGYAQEAMSWAVATGLITGRTESDIVPGGTASRAEIAAILMRFLI